jgi:hypothetical protein
MTGTVERFCGSFENPEDRAYGRQGEMIPLYRVRLLQRELWSPYEGPEGDTLEIEIFDHWLSLAEKAS